MGGYTLVTLFEGYDGQMEIIARERFPILVEANLEMGLSTSESLSQAIFDLNVEIATLSERRLESQDTSSKMLAILLGDQKMTVASVGDSKAALFIPGTTAEYLGSTPANSQKEARLLTKNAFGTSPESVGAKLTEPYLREMSMPPPSSYLVVATKEIWESQDLKEIRASLSRGRYIGLDKIANNLIKNCRKTKARCPSVVVYFE